MDVRSIEAAVQQLRAQGERISVRRVRQITRGSFRDVSRQLRALGESPAAADADDGAPAAVTPARPAAEVLPGGPRDLVPAVEPEPGVTPAPAADVLPHLPTPMGRIAQAQRCYKELEAMLSVKE